MDIIAELRRRNVFRVSAAYLALGWVVTQVTSTVAPALHLPDWIVPVVVWAGVIGFPFVIVFSWVYELTPEGLKRDRDVDPGGSMAYVTNRRLDYIAIGLFTLAIVLFAADKFVASRSPPAASPGNAASAGGTTGAGPSSGSVTAPLGAKSVAVLPFKNLAESAETMPFVAGIHDDLLTQLAKIGALKVISRTSVMEYANTTKRLPEIAKELGVATILEGGVQRAGNRMRLNVQLIRAATDEHLWAETYDRELTAENVFAIQSEVAASIAAALKTALSPEEKANVGRVLTTDLTALEGYQRALVLIRRSGPEDLEKAEAEVDAALKRDSHFAAAWAAKARIDLAYLWTQGRDSSYRDKAWAAIEQGRAITADLPELDVAEAEYHYRGFRDYSKALASIERARRAEPNNLDLILLQAFNLRRIGRVPEMLGAFERAQALSPRDAASLADLPWTYYWLGRYAEADAAADRLLDIDPGFGYLHSVKALLDVDFRGDIDAAAARMAGITPSDDIDSYVRWWLANARGRYDEALLLSDFGVLAQSTSDGFYPRELMRGLTLRFAGRSVEANAQVDDAIALLEKKLAGERDATVQRALCVALGARGKREAAVTACQAAVKLAPVDALLRPILMRDAADALALAGATENALATLEQGLDDTFSFGARWFEFDPALRSLHDDPRFNAIMQRYRERPPR